MQHPMPAEKLQSMYPRVRDGYAMPGPKPDRMNVENSDFAVPAGRKRFYKKKHGSLPAAITSISNELSHAR